MKRILAASLVALTSCSLFRAQAPSHGQVHAAARAAVSVAIDAWIAEATICAEDERVQGADYRACKDALLPARASLVEAAGAVDDDKLDDLPCLLADVVKGELAAAEVLTQTRAGVPGIVSDAALLMAPYAAKCAPEAGARATMECDPYREACPIR